MSNSSSSLLNESYQYDADGERIVRIAGGVTTVYSQNVWEQTTTGARKLYYTFNGEVVAMRDSSTNAVTWLQGDQLGSVSMATNSAGQVVSKQDYTPWGQVRSGSAGTSLNYPGQRLDSTGLLYYHARYYNPYLARFISADGVVPHPMDPQDLNRYSYVHNNPLRYTDPTGHCAAEDSECWQRRDQVADHIGYAPSGTEAWSTAQLQHLLDWIMRGILFTSNSGSPGDSTGATWTAANISDVLKGLDKVQAFLGDKTDTYLGLGGGGTLTFNKFAGTNIGGWTHQDTNIVDLYLTDDSSSKAVWTTIHELGHVVDWHLHPSGGGWSESSSGWEAASGWSHSTGIWKLSHAGARGLSSSYHDDPREDFAETFLLMVDPGESSFSPAATNPSRKLDPNRANAINTALGR
jgi:RHS repeat-associated protein